MFSDRPRVSRALASTIIGWTLLFARVAAAQGFQPNCNGGTILNHNGHVMVGGVDVYLIWYGGKNAQQFSGYVAQAVTYLNALSESSYMAMNTTYYQNQATAQPFQYVLGDFSVAGEVADPGSQGEGTLADWQIRAIVQNAIAGGDVDANTGAPTSLLLDSTGVYMVLLPSQVFVGTSPNQPFNSNTVCVASGLCGYHQNFQINNADIKYAVIGEPDQFCSQCQWGKGATQTPTNKVFDAKINIMTHELEEALTDPDGFATWSTSSQAESADLCAWAVGSTFPTLNGGVANLVLRQQPYLIQMQWVNENGGYGANGYGLPFGNGTNWGFQGNYGSVRNPLGNWSFGNFQAQCSPGQPVIGISEAVGETEVHSVLCGNGQDYLDYPQTVPSPGVAGCHDLPFNEPLIETDLAANPEGDWAFGSVKAECGLNEYVAGVSRAPTNPPAAGQINSILCCPGSVHHRQCDNIELFYGQDSRDYTPPDWDYGYYKGQCLPGKYVAGVAALAGVGAADVLLCCLP